MYIFGLLYIASAFPNCLYALIEGKRFKKDFAKEFSRVNPHFDGGTVADITLFVAVFVPIINTIFTLYMAVTAFIQMIDNIKK